MKSSMFGIDRGMFVQGVSMKSLRSPNYGEYISFWYRVVALSEIERAYQIASLFSIFIVVSLEESKADAVGARVHVD